MKSLKIPLSVTSLLKSCGNLKQFGQTHSRKDFESKSVKAHLDLVVISGYVGYWCVMRCLVGTESDSFITHVSAV